MKSLLLCATLLSATALASGADSPAAAFERYRQALLAKDGRAATATLDAESVAYYERMRKLALHGAPAAVKALPLIDRISVLRMRHEVGRARLEQMDGAALITYAVDHGWVSESSVRQAKVGKVVVKGNSATGRIVVGDQVAPPEFSWRFHREAGVWKFNLVSLFRLGEGAVRETARQSGGTEDEFAFAILEKLSGKALSEDIWQPLSPADGGEQ